MRADGFLKEVLIYRNVDKGRYKPFVVTLADKNPEGTYPVFDRIETIRTYPEMTEINVYDLKRPVYYRLPDGTRRKVIYPKKKTQSSAPRARIDEK